MIRKVLIGFLLLFLSAGQLLADAKIDHIKAQIRKALPDIPLANLDTTFG